MSQSGIRAGRAFVEIGADASILEREFKRAGAAFNDLGKKLSTIGGAMAGAGASILAPLSAMALKFASAGSELNDMSARTGASVENLSALAFAASMTGAKIEDVETAFKKSAKVITEAAGGSDSATKALNDLGLSAAQLQGLSPDQQFAKLAAAINQISDPTTKAAAAMAVFGRSGTALLPMIADIDALTARARELGVVMSGESAARADALGDALDSVKAAVGGASNAIGSALAPAFTTIANAAAGVVARVSAFAQAHEGLIQGIATGAAAMVGLGGALATAGTAMAFIGPALAGVGTILAAITSPIGLLAGAVAAVAGAFTAAAFSGDGLVGKLATLQPMFTEIQAAATIAFEAILAAVLPAVAIVQDAIGTAWSWIQDKTGGVFQFIADTVTSTFTAIAVAANNWQVVLAAAFVGAALSTVSFFNVIGHYATYGVDVLAHLATNWRSVFTDIWSFTNTVADNLALNLYNFFGAVSSWLSGDGFSFEWTGLTTGFQRTLAELPGIAQREISGLEAELKAEFQALSGEIASAYGREQTKVGAKAAELHRSAAEAVTPAEAGKAAGKANPVTVATKAVKAAATHAKTEARKDETKFGAVGGFGAQGLGALFSGIQATIDAGRGRTQSGHRAAERAIAGAKTAGSENKSELVEIAKSTRYLADQAKVSKGLVFT